MNEKNNPTQVGLFAYPAGHTASPSMHNAAFEKLGLTFEYKAYEVKPEDLKTAVKNITKDNMRGVNITIPHKVAVLPFLDEISKEAQLIGAVNTIVNDAGRLCGHNTDAVGFIKALSEGIEASGINGVRGMKACVYGAGGASRAVTVALALNGISSIAIFDKVNEPKDALATHIKENFSDIDVLNCDAENLQEITTESDIIVNCTPVGMSKFPGSPVNKNWLSGKHIVFDLVYNPKNTQLLNDARAAGAKGIEGLGMLVLQGAEAFKLWTGHDAPVDIMKKAVEEFLNSKG